MFKLENCIYFFYFYNKNLVMDQFDLKYISAVDLEALYRLCILRKDSLAHKLTYDKDTDEYNLFFKAKEILDAEVKRRIIELVKNCDKK